MAAAHRMPSHESNQISTWIIGLRRMLNDQEAMKPVPKVIIFPCLPCPLSGEHQSPSSSIGIEFNSGNGGTFKDCKCAPNTHYVIRCPVQMERAVGYVQMSARATKLNVSHLYHYTAWCLMGCAGEHSIITWGLPADSHLTAAHSLPLPQLPGTREV